MRTEAERSQTRRSVRRRCFHLQKIISPYIAMLILRFGFAVCMEKRAWRPHQYQIHRGKLHRMFKY